MTRLISVPLGPFAKDHRTGDEMCKCIQAFLSARRSVIPTNPIVRLKRVSQEESQEDYGNLDLDLEDPTLLALLDNTDQIADQNHVADQKASEVGFLLLPFLILSSADIRHIFASLLCMFISTLELQCTPWRPLLRS